MNCSGVKYISKYVYPENLECWIIDKAANHICLCPECAVILRLGYSQDGFMANEKSSISQHVDECDRCNQEYRIGKTTTTKGGTHARPTKRVDHTARLNQFRYSVPRLDHAWIPSRRR